MCQNYYENILLLIFCIIFKPELEIVVTLDQQLLSEEELAKSNIVTVTLESLYSPPEPWLTATQPYAYTVSLPLPVTEEVWDSHVIVAFNYLLFCLFVKRKTMRLFL
jgi:hypothetical protein